MSCNCTLMTQLSLGQIPFLIIRSDGKAKPSVWDL